MTSSTYTFEISGGASRQSFEQRVRFNSISSYSLRAGARTDILVIERKDGLKRLQIQIEKEDTNTMREFEEAYNAYLSAVDSDPTAMMLDAGSAIKLFAQDVKEEMAEAAKRDIEEFRNECKDNIDKFHNALNQKVETNIGLVQELIDANTAINERLDRHESEQDAKYRDLSERADRILSTIEDLIKRG